MSLKNRMARGLMLAGLVTCLQALASSALPDYQEFGAALQVPFRAAASRPVVLYFEYPGAAAGTPVAWEISLLGRDGSVSSQWSSNTIMQQRTAQARVNWVSRDRRSRPLAAGSYTLATCSNKDAASGYQQHTISLNGDKGQILQINLYGHEDSTKQTSFVVDDVSVKTQ